MPHDDDQQESDRRDDPALVPGTWSTRTSSGVAATRSRGSAPGKSSAKGHRRARDNLYFAVVEQKRAGLTAWARPPCQARLGTHESPHISSPIDETVISAVLDWSHAPPHTAGGGVCGAGRTRQMTAGARADRRAWRGLLLQPQAAQSVPLLMQTAAGMHPRLNRCANYGQRTKAQLQPMPATQHRLVHARKAVRRRPECMQA